MTSFFNNILPTGMHLPSLPNPMSFLSKQEDPPQQHQQSSPQPEQPQQPSQPPHAHDPPHSNPVSDTETHDDRGARRRKQPSETFIIVRPPPAKNNHPLNLQIQLIPPSIPRDRANSNRRSAELSRDEAQTPTTPDSAGPPGPEGGLTRRPSVRSDRSASLYSSVASTSVTSLASTASGRRVVPLYNLSAHNVIQNTVLDAGTDAKVAKFLKKGIEVVQVAYLEPFEFSDHSDELLDRRYTRASDNSHLSQIDSIDENSPRTSFSHERPSLTSPHVTELLAPPQPEAKKGKKGLGKMFKRRNDSISDPATVQASPIPSTTLAPTLASSPSISSIDTQLLAPTLGLQPTLGSRPSSHHNRARSYVWIVRKWLKPTGENWLNKGLNNLRIGPNQNDPMANVELRFEWTKAGDAHRQRGRRKSIDPASDMSAAASYRNSVISVDGASLAPPSTYERSPTPSINRRSVSPRASVLLRAPPPASAETSSTNSQSDSEDDDTPWTCTLVIDSGQAKMRVAALVPAPHHPKLLGQVKLPFPLPDVALERGQFLPRVEGVDNSEAGILLTAEDIKDIIASTCLWLVVREGFGGIDKKRPGDGWRIRS